MVSPGHPRLADSNLAEVDDFFQDVKILITRVFETSGEYFGPIGMRMGSGEGSTMRNFIVCTVHLILSG